MLIAKDGKRYAKTGGRGFEEFTGGSQTEGALTAQAKMDCYDGHSHRKSHDLAFSTFRK